MTAQRTRTPPPRKRAAWLRPMRPAGWAVDAVMIGAFVAVTASLSLPAVRRADLAIRDVCDRHRGHSAEVAVTWVNRLGSGGGLAVLAAGIAVVLMWSRRSLWPVAPVIAAFLATSALISPLKLLFHRAAPHSPLADNAEVRLFSQTGGLSYPSGHAVNTIVWYGILCLLLAPWLHPTVRRWARVVPPVVVGFTATYLGFHWLTDMVAGLLLGVIIFRLLDRVAWPDVPAVPDTRTRSTPRSDAEHLDPGLGERGHLSG